MPFNYKTELKQYRKYYQSIEPIFTKPSSRGYTTVIFSFLAVSLFGWYAIRPTIQTILYLRREIADKTELNKEMEDKISALIEAQAYYQQIEPLLPVVDQALPPQPDAVPFFIQLRNVASASGVLLSTIQTPTIPLVSNSLQKGQATSPPASQPAYIVTIQVRGLYDGVKSFLTNVNNLRRVVTVDSINISPTDTTHVSSQSALPSSRLLQASLELKTYYLTK
ncbi:MAG TPA: type 4a pilus biogenesis protein PilO [Patescibacteria group bacterium]|nr:type 4a pilus biogenesis protein PilO [Patescibacteria group bacterium]